MDSGPYLVTLTLRDEESGAETRVVRASYWSADRERRARGVNRDLLTHIASLSGGRMLGANESPFDAPRRAARRDASMWASIAALVMFVLDIATSGGIGGIGIDRWRRQFGGSAQNRAAA
jgi:hypothetical protein